MRRLLLLLPTRTYRTDDFMAAVAELGVPIDLVVGAERRNALEAVAGAGTVKLDLGRPERSLDRVRAMHAEGAFSAIVGVDDEAVLAAAVFSEALGLRHNSPESVRRASHKVAFRSTIAAHGLAGPRYCVLPASADPTSAALEIARQVGFPCVLKPVTLSASRGVIRADGEATAAAAFERIVRILEAVDDTRVESPDVRDILAETYLEGVEVAVEGLVTDGRLTVLAVFDKPDAMEGPFFEETLYITPSRHGSVTQEAITACVGEAVIALGLAHGPVHAEVRLTADGPVLLELAPRSIGGLCARTLRFAVGESLEVVLLRHALDLASQAPSRDDRAAGVMMIPIPRRGILNGVIGVEEACARPLIEEVHITHPMGQPIEPLPEGARYLGFIFARGDSSDQVETALRQAHRALSIDIFDEVGDARADGPSEPC